MMGVWLVLISLAHPQQAPRLVERFTDIQACHQAAITGNNVGTVPSMVDKTPAGKAFLCMQFAYPV